MAAAQRPEIPPTPLSKGGPARPFGGFPRGVRFTPVPDPLFGPLLEQIDDLTELKVTLRAIWLYHRKHGSPRLLSRDELCNDLALRRGVAAGEESPEPEIQRGLARAVARGSLLHYQPDPGVPQKRFYLLNTEGERQALARLWGDGRPPSDQRLERQDEGIFDAPAGDKANIFVLYEQNIGATIGPLLAEQLKDAEEAYPWPWIVEAFRIAVAGNIYNWRYIEGILRRWAAEGRNDGELGRHSQADNRTKYLDEYQRRRGHLPWEQTRPPRAGG